MSNRTIKLLIICFVVCSIQCTVFDPLVKYVRIYKYYNSKALGNRKLPVALYVEVLSECFKYGVSVNLMLAVTHKETGFTNVICSDNDDIGYFQINRAQVVAGEKFEDYYDMHKNVHKAITIFLSALHKANGDVRKALAYYNAGENYNLANYKGWKTYVDYIIANAKACDVLDQQEITIE